MSIAPKMSLVGIAANTLRKAIINGCFSRLKRITDEYIEDKMSGYDTRKVEFDEKHIPREYWYDYYAIKGMVEHICNKTGVPSERVKVISLEGRRGKSFTRIDYIFVEWVQNAGDHTDTCVDLFALREVAGWL